ncbi:cell division control protein 6 homolog [Cephus cinctus]|uniref:Cell division control protein n=1 Tax=Cephus cinctus TaxID=211228 RepID=A0AAJ7FCB2_CEPCN|nr:cell division control protein 6 homolog [Cephus cinctus]
MTSVQTTIPFTIRKKTTFYGSKENAQKQDFTGAALRSTPSTKYTSIVKKIVTVSSSESDSDSDAENLVQARGNYRNNIEKENNIARTPRRIRKSSSSEEQGCTPPKQKKTEKQVSPTTPATLLKRLDIASSPEGIERLAPKRLFASEKYQNARKALHSSTPENLPGREAELAQLYDFMYVHMKNKTSGSLYVSGPPGTGKTACLSKTMLHPEFKSSFKIIYVNCTTMKSATTIYAKIVQELGLGITKSVQASKAAIEKYLISNHKMILLILDEIDQLDCKKQSVLYSIFEWPSKPNSKLILVGIANALDLTDRILPRLQARCELKPKLMHFAPYSKQEIVNIITDRLKQADVSDVFTTMAMQMLAGKVAAVSGDVRRALDISRRVVELAESQNTAQVLQPTNHNEKNTGSPKKQNVHVEKPVDFKEVVTVLNGVYGGSQNINKDENTFPLQQKFLLCSLMLILNKGKNKVVTIGKLQEVYKKVCRKRNIHAVDISEFVGLCSLVETRGIIRVSGKKEPRLSKVHLQWDQDELGAALQDKHLMAEIINDVTCL